MSKFLLIILLSLILFFTFNKNQATSNEIKHDIVQVNSYQDAISLSNEQNKKVFILFKNKQCIWCDRQKNVIQDTEVLDSLANHIICFIDTDEEKYISSMYKIKAVPVLIEISNDEKLIKKNVGYLEKNKFIEWIQK